jgi:hypothetical protein
LYFFCFNLHNYNYSNLIFYILILQWSIRHGGSIFLCPEDLLCTSYPISKIHYITTYPARRTKVAKLETLYLPGGICWWCSGVGRVGSRGIPGCCASSRYTPVGPLARAPSVAASLAYGTWHAGFETTPAWNITILAPPWFGRHIKMLVPTTTAVVSSHQSGLGLRGG